MSRFLIVVVFIVINLNSIIEARNPTKPPLCRPDQVFHSETRKCLRLKHSISTLLKEILDNSDSSVPFLHYTPETLNRGLVNTSLPSLVQVSDLFIQNLAFISEANMTDCIAMSACNEHCYSWPERKADQRESEESVIDKFLTNTESPSKKDDEDETPDFVRVVMEASRKGIDLAKHAQSITAKNIRSICSGCQTDYSDNCAPMNYAYTVRINALYRKLIESNVTFVNMAPKLPQNLSPEMLYYHYSMHFVDRANLTTCYALVSCENTCQLYKATIAELGESVVEAPPEESVLLKGDPNKSVSIDIIHHGVLVGFKLAKSDDGCEECRNNYPDCTNDRYEIAKASAAIFGTN
ncbi:hypothetical protein SSS_05580 [Sarcoptes scabiei]|uniref:Uncharacterized protein n=2 Tax=Sarcoptes scabiei TaxID=52283 RepID=A0A834VD99_SARSC|nr:hypothetical protein SSS_05580 [Sarcoptes scabiei]